VHHHSSQYRWRPPLQLSPLLLFLHCILQQLHQSTRVAACRPIKMEHRTFSKSKSLHRRKLVGSLPHQVLVFGFFAYHVASFMAFLRCIGGLLEFYIPSFVYSFLGVWIWRRTEREWGVWGWKNRSIGFRDPKRRMNVLWHVSLIYFVFDE
jgi:hypothetical protein